MALFPGALPAAGAAVASDTLSAAGHTSLHNTGADESRAIANKVGTGASTPTSGMLLRGNGSGTSAWAQAVLTSDVSGVLPQANGGTGTTLASGSGTPVYQTSPTINTPTITAPTIASFTNAQHNHQNAVGGGQIAAAAITSLDLTNTTLNNPYKFSVYRSAAQTSSNAAKILVQFDTKLFDTGSNVDIVTNKGRFTAPVAGFYHFDACVGDASANSTSIAAALYKNGSGFKLGLSSAGTLTPTDGNNSVVSGTLKLAAGDYVEVFFVGGSGTQISVGQSNCYFDGFLVSTT